MDYLSENYHTHTYRCHHAYGQDREFVEAAIRAGIKTLGFSDHIPIPSCPDKISHMRMSVDQTEGYVSSVRTLKKEYKDDIEILLGYEGEYFPAYFDAQMEFIKPFGYDYLILGQHYLQNFDYIYCGNETDNSEMLSDYVDTCIEGMSTGAYMYLCHPDLINYTGDKDFYLQEMRRLFTFCAKSDVMIEINLLGFLKKRNYPNIELAGMIKELGCRTIMGIDAHEPDQIGLRQPYLQALDYLKG